MADFPLILGQSNPSATTLTSAYTVSLGRYAVVSTVVICNQGVGKGSFRVSIVKSGDGDLAKQYIFYDQELASKASFVVTIGISLSAGDQIKVYASSANFSFNICGLEVV